MMRYLWGLGVGHHYSHSDAPEARETRVLQSTLSPPSSLAPSASPSVAQIQVEVRADAMPSYDSQEVSNTTCNHSAEDQEHEYKLADREEAEQNWYSDAEEENICHRVQEPESESED